MAFTPLNSPGRGGYRVMRPGASKLREPGRGVAVECIFCRILGGSLPAYFVYRRRGVAVFLDKYPVSKGHLLVVPEEHYESVHDTPPCAAAKVWAAASAYARFYREKLGALGVNVVTNSGRAAGQEVFHFHVHVIPRWGYARGRGMFGGRHELTEEEAEEVSRMLEGSEGLVDSYLDAVESGCGAAARF